MAKFLSEIDLSKIEAVVFDMDGVLIDSEPFWKQTEIKVFDSVGIDFEAVGGEKTVGLRIDEVVAYWFARYPWKGKSKQMVVDEIMERMVEQIKTQGAPMTGVHEIMAFLATTHYKVGLASSSFQRLIDATLDRLGIRKYFEVVLSAEHLPYGKPHPQIYISAAEKLDVDPSNCLVIEDSLNGVIAAKAAKMNVIAIPDGTHTPDPKIILADYVAKNLDEVKGMLEGVLGQSRL